LKTPYTIVHLPWLCRLYRFAFDHSSLSTPSLIAGYKTPFRYLSKYLFQSKKIFRFSKGKFTFRTKKKSRRCEFTKTNTQFHSLYFKRFNPCYEPEICACLNLLLKNVQCFYDIGANWGYFVGYVAANPDFTGKIHAFEPERSSYTDLPRFVEEAELSRTVSTYPISLSNKKSTGRVFLPDGFHSGLATLNVNSHGNITLDKLDNLKIKAPDVIKIDAKSEEANIIQGAEELINKNKPYLIFEYFPQKNNRLLQQLHAMQCRTYQLIWIPNTTLNQNLDRGYLECKELLTEPVSCRLSKMNILACHREKSLPFTNL
jgi:FkbM family methyltransferase